MKNTILCTLLLIGSVTFAQSTNMIEIFLEDGKEVEYLEKEKNWNIAAQAMVDAGMIQQWSVWKRTPREGDESWAQYYVFRRTSVDQDSNPNNYNKMFELIYKAFKGKRSRTVDKMLSMDNLFKDRRERQYKWVSTTGWLGLEWEIGDKGYFHFMTQKNEDFVSYEDQLWKPVAQQEILDGHRKFWGLGEITSVDEATKALDLDHTHIAFNFMTNEKNHPEYHDNHHLPSSDVFLSQMQIPDDFLTQKAWKGLSNSREQTPSEELTLIYSTF